MSNDYLDSRQSRKKKAVGYVWVLLAAALIFTFIIISLTRTGVVNIGGMPSSDQAYEVAKNFVKATVRSNNVDFPNSGYQFAKKSDSIYVIRSTVETKSESGDEKRSNFKVVMQYKGGMQDEMRNWNLLNISEE